MVITYSQGLKDRGGGLWNIFAKTSWQTNKFFSSFSTLCSGFSWTWKSISQQNLLVKALFRNTLSFLYVWFCIQGWGGGGGVLGHWWNWVLIIMLCKLSDSFYKNPHHLEEDFIDDYTCMLWWFVHTYKIGTKTNFNLLLKMFSIQKISFILEYKFISITPQKSWICKGVLLVMGNNKMP